MLLSETRRPHGSGERAARGGEGGTQPVCDDRRSLLSGLPGADRSARIPRVGRTRRPARAAGSAGLRSRSGSERRMASSRGSRDAPASSVRRVRPGRVRALDGRKGAPCGRAAVAGSDLGSAQGVCVRRRSSAGPDRAHAVHREHGEGEAGRQDLSRRVPQRAGGHGHRPGPRAATDPGWA